MLSFVLSCGVRVRQWCVCNPVFSIYRARFGWADILICCFSRGLPLDSIRPSRQMPVVAVFSHPKLAVVAFNSQIGLIIHSAPIVWDGELALCALGVAIDQLQRRQSHTHTQSQRSFKCKLCAFGRALSAPTMMCALFFHSVSFVSPSCVSSMIEATSRCR